LREDTKMTLKRWRARGPQETPENPNSTGRSRRPYLSVLGATLTADVMVVSAACSDDGADTTTTIQPENEESLRSDLGEEESFGAGTYTMVGLATPVTFTVRGEWETRPVLPGFFAIARPDNTRPGEHDMVFARPTGLLDATVGGAGLAANDLNGWLATVPDTASVSEPVARTVDGISAVTFEVMIGADVACAPGGGFSGCVPLLQAGPSFDFFLNRGFRYEVFWIDHSDGPIVVINGTRQDEPDWLDVARGVVATLEIG
jgi:hypothetical protein